jgi:hypothetical protein
VTCLQFPDDVPWYQTIEELPTSGSSDAYIASIKSAPRFTSGTFHAGFDAEGGGVAYNVIQGAVADPQPLVFIDAESEAQSDPGPYPIPPRALARDNYLVVVDDASCTSYEVYGLDETAPWTQAQRAAVFPLNELSNRADGQVSAIQSGLPLFPLLVRFDEVATGRVDHALLFNAPTLSTRYMAPATISVHSDDATDDPDRAPLGSRFRLRADHDCGDLETSQGRVVCRTLQTYGMYLGGASGALFDLQGVSDPRWTDEFLDDMKRLTPDDFEVVDTGEEIKQTPTG